MRKPVETLSTEETRLLSNVLCPTLEGLPHRCKSIRNYTAALLMLDAGLRVGEVSKLNIDDLWFANTPRQAVTIRKEISKTRRERTVPLSARLRAAIAVMGRLWWSEYLIEGAGPAIQQSKSGNRLTVRQIQRIIGKASELAFGRRIRPHSLRHTFATRLMRTTNIRIVQELLGHASITSTQIYTHPATNDLKNAIDNIDS